jgi:Tfp pilus assembly protein PilV
MARNSRGISLPETLVSMALFASISATATSLFLTFNHYYTQSLKNLDRARTANQILNTIRSSRLSDMILPPTINKFDAPNGAINSIFKPETVSSYWYWKVSGKNMIRLEPQLYALTINNSICIPDLDASISFNREAGTLAFRYSRTKESELLQCLGASGSQEIFGLYTWKNVQEVEVVKLDGSGLSLWVKYDGEWFSSLAGEVE